MNEVDAAEILNGVIGNALSAQAIFFTALSAYLVIAYSFGAKLTKYQVAYVNFIFLLVFLNMSVSQFGLIESTTHYVDIIQAARGTDERIISAQGNRLVFVAIRGLMLLGAVLFMWQVRHPRAD